MVSKFCLLICCLTDFAAQTWLKVLFEDGKRGTVTFKDNENCQRFLQAIIMIHLKSNEQNFFTVLSLYLLTWLFNYASSWN